MAGPVLRHIRCLAAARDRAASDADLLHRFRHEHDQAAFEAIVRRHGKLVFGVCRHVLGHTEDAEDAFQATFLTLARRAGSVRNPGALSAWLHGVAHHTALHARRDAARRRARERQIRPVPPVQSPGELSLCEIQALLDAEVQRLPEPYRTVFVVCVLESRGTAEAAAQLGWKTGTVSGRLTRARQMLLRGLARLGVTLSAALTAAALEPHTARAAVPHALTAAAARMAAVVDRGTGLTSARVLDLAQGVGRSTVAVRLGAVLTLALTTALVAAGLGTTFCVSAGAEPAAERPADKAGKARPANAADELKDVPRTIKKEPVYKTKNPRYCLLVFGPEAKDRVWLVHDGDTLYVDRNGNGDLTEPDKKVIGTLAEPLATDKAYYIFNVDELPVGGRAHKYLTVVASKLARSHNSVESRVNARAALAADPNARAYTVSIELDWPWMKGKGVGGRVNQWAGPADVDGALLFGDKPADAPVIHFGGPLKVTFEAEPPKLKLGWKNTAILVVGAPGRGPGTLAMLAYDGTIPDAAVPVVDAVFPPARAGEPSVQCRYELKERCCGVNLYGTVELPESAGPGMATVTLSLPSWKGQDVVATTHSLPVLRRNDKMESLSPRFIRSLLHPERRAQMPLARFSPDSKRLLTAGYSLTGGGGTVQFWDVAAGKELYRIQPPGTRDLVMQADLPADWSALYVPFEKQTVTEFEEKGKRDWQVDYEAAVLVYDPATGKPRPSVKLLPGHGFSQSTVSPDGRKLITVDKPSRRGNNEQRWSTVLRDTATGTSKVFHADATTPAFSPDSRHIVLNCTDTNPATAVLRLFDAAGNDPVVLAAEKNVFFSRTRFSPGGRLLAAQQHARSPQGTTPRCVIRVWDLTTRKEVKQFPSGAEAPFSDFTFSPDGRQLAATDQGAAVRVWDVGTEKLILQKTFSDKLSSHHVVFAPDGKRLAVEAAPRVRVEQYMDLSPDPQDFEQLRVYLFDLADPSAGPEVVMCPPGLAGALAWSPDGKTLAVGGSGAVHLFDMTRPK
jgi:RNA polymerase sigma factor (sigma-70 family)